MSPKAFHANGKEDLPSHAWTVEEKEDTALSGAHLSKNDTLDNSIVLFLDSLLQLNVYPVGLKAWDD